MMAKGNNSSDNLSSKIDTHTKHEEEHKEHEEHEDEYQSEDFSEYSDSDISDDEDDDELEPITVDDPVDVWLDRLIELAVNTYQKKYIAVEYDRAFKEGLKDFSITDVYQEMDKFNQAKWVYNAFYADFYKNFIPATLLSQSDIKREAEQCFIDYPESNNSAGFQDFLQTLFEEKFKSELAGLILKFKTESSDDTSDSSSEASIVMRPATLSFFKPKESEESNLDDEKKPSKSG